MKTFTTILGLLCVSATLALAGANKAGWDDDYAKGLAEAAKENKLVLLDFTGSDWCGWCIKLDEEVFSKTEFKRFAKDKLVLVELDYPKGKNQTKKIKEQNAELKTKFKVSGYPTIVLVDAEGKEQARWVGYKATLMDELKAKVPAGAATPAEKK